MTPMPSHPSSYLFLTVDPEQRVMPDQRSLEDQMVDLLDTAVREGWYDAHEWIIRRWRAA